MNIINKVPQRAQVNFFSATFPEEIRNGIADNLNQRDTKIMHIKVAEQKLGLKGIKQFFIKARDNKGKIIDDILKNLSEKTVIIFVNTRHYAEKVSNYLYSQGHQIAFLSGKLTKEEREQLMEMYNAGKLKLLITTDLLARGYDNREVHLIINLDIPKIHKSEEPNYETYMHRVGRTGRFGDRGVALNIVGEPADLDRLRKIKDKYNIEIE